MHIVLNEGKQRLAVLGRRGVQLLALSAEGARPLDEVEVEQGRFLVGCDDYLAVVSGELAPAGASIVRAQMTRYSWELSRLGVTELGEVEKNHLSLSADGRRLATTDWASCAIVLRDALTGAQLASGHDDGIPSGAALSPDGTWIIAGSADQGDGAILRLSTAAVDGRLPVAAMPEPSPCPGLDDAPYFGIVSPRGDLAALSNETWGGRGVFVYDMASLTHRWSELFDATSEECEEWYPAPLAFSADQALLLVRHPEGVEAFRTSDGERLGKLIVEGDARHGFALEDARRRLWIPGATPRAYGLPAAWA